MAPAEFHYSRRVQFADTDMAGIVHFARFFQYMEEAEHAFLRSLGTSVVGRDSEGEVGWPRVSVACDFFQPARFDDVLDIRVTIAKRGRSSVTYHILMTLDGAKIAEGRTTAVYCRLEPGQKPKSLPLPEWLAEKLTPETPA